MTHSYRKKMTQNNSFEFNLKEKATKKNIFAGDSIKTEYYF